MAKTHIIRKSFFDEGKNISEIARETNCSRKTIRKYIYKDDWNQETVVSDRPSKLDPYKNQIDEWMEDDKTQKRKQRHTAKRIFTRLVEKFDGFDVSYRTVAKYVSITRRQIYQTRRGFLPLLHIPGEAQVDFGEADFIENGTRFQGSYLTLSLPHSNGGFHQLFYGQSFECLAQGMKDIFEEMGGVPTRIWFDNARSMVSKIKENGERDLNDSFLRFMNHYGFEATFCNPDSGNEKGSVENKVGYQRRNFLVPIPEFSEINEYNRQTLDVCRSDMQRLHYRKKLPISSLFDEDVSAFYPLPSVPLDIRTEVTVRVDNYGKITLSKGKHRYSTIPRLAGSSVTVVLRAHELTVLDENLREVVRHRRFYGGREQESMDWIPYLEQLSRYPTAFKYNGIHSMLPDPVKVYLEDLNRHDRGKALRVLSSMTKETGFPSAVRSFKESLKMGRSNLDDVMAIHNRLSAKWPEMEQLKLSTEIPILNPINTDASAYDRMIQSGENR